MRLKRWNIGINKDKRLLNFRTIQRDIAEKISLEDKFKKIRKVVGFDLAFSKDNVICAAIVVDYKSLKVLEKRYVICKETIGYIPTFLTFREGPPILEVYKRLENKPDILLFDGNGILHPLRVGIASHIGVVLKKPSIGVAKSLLCGELKGDYIYMDNEKVGYRLKNKRFKPIYISPGHRISLESSVRIARKLIRNHRLPEPLILAHRYANETKNRCDG